MLNPGNDAEKLDYSFILDRNVKYNSHWERKSVVSYAGKHKTTIWPRNFVLGHLSKRNENLGSHKNQCMNISSSLIFNRQTWKKLQLSFREWVYTNCGTFKYGIVIIDEKWVIYILKHLDGFFRGLH